MVDESPKPALFGKPTDTAAVTPPPADAAKAPDVPGSAQGQGSPSPTPTFGKKDFTDENFNRLDKADLDSAKQGAAAFTAGNTTSDALIAADSAGDAPDDGSVQYASPSIARLKLGSFQFENGTLRVKPEDVERFEKILSTATVQTRQAVHKIDREGGEAVARRFLEQTKGKRTSGVDTTANSVGGPTPGDQQHAS